MRALCWNYGDIISATWGPCAGAMGTLDVLHWDRQDTVLGTLGTMCQYHEEGLCTEVLLGSS